MQDQTIYEGAIGKNNFLVIRAEGFGELIPSSFYKHRMVNVREAR